MKKDGNKIFQRETNLEFMVNYVDGILQGNPNVANLVKRFIYNAYNLGKNTAEVRSMQERILEDKKYRRELALARFKSYKLERRLQNGKVLE